MTHLIKLTLLADVVNCLVMFLFYLLIDPDFALMALFYSFGLLLFPTFIAVLIFRFLRTRTILSGWFRTIGFQVLTLSVVFLMGIFIWASTDVLLFGHLHRGSWTIISEFNSEFKAWLPALFSLALFIPIIDRRISRNE